MLRIVAITVNFIFLAVLAYGWQEELVKVYHWGYKTDNEIVVILPLLMIVPIISLLALFKLPKDSKQISTPKEES